MLNSETKRGAVGAAGALVSGQDLQRQVRLMTYLMFFVFAMTTDAVGVIIPQAMAEYQLTLFQASAFHYVPMLAIGLAGLFLGRLADKLGRKKLIIAGLSLYSLSCYAFAIGNSAMFFILLMGLCGLAIGIFKTAALALIGDISPDSKSHTRTMNTVEGYFSIFKRGMKGIYQHCGEQHLHRYLAEFDFRYSNRVALGVDDVQRAEIALQGVVGKRLTYKKPDGQRAG